ncbi:alpha/beta fold hydrolase [Mycobacterium branderi]|uniref:Alpha/beta hydrolase n=1 Tax=Mycobacterium branderi TaxID=43348 RepID=A0A7I7W0P4_9MYCO|nr:alpha/beta hydrolase [Mycobacterium branderi]MCV7233378.1 alpha/beta fold hydrolase [Mycobacterium branderi]ORA41435.1 alpha/beta hydrolase [Mycobacterium branderi]BBZ10492.1 putative lipase/esterase LipG [Mycobacterium branderi]
MLTRSGLTRGDVELYYEDLGDPAAPPVLLIMGLGAQLPMWPDGFCARLVDAGYRVIRFDHRDTGLSAKLHGLRAEGSVYRRAWRYVLGRTSPVPYTLVDMTRDVVALLGHLDIDRAHVVGASMGGMIAQILAATEPRRVASLGLVMSATGKPFSALPAWRVIKLRFDAPGKDASDEDKLAYEARNVAVFNGPHFLPPADELRKRVEQLAERSNYPPGRLRQVDALLGTGSLLAYTKAITAPTVVIHGSHDPMVRPRNGRALAAAIGGARFVVVDGMGHDLPEPVWRPIVETLQENFARRAS